MKVKYAFILEKFEKYLIYKRYSQRTISIYMHYVKEFLNFIGKSPAHISQIEVESYLLTYNYTSESQQNQVISSVKLFVDKILGLNIKKIKCERPRRAKKLPEVLSVDEIHSIIDAIPNLKHRAIISTIYGLGLRRSEAINLQLHHINSNTMLVKIYQGKGNKDRLVPIGTDLLQLLREYYKQFKPKVYLFEGKEGVQYSASSIRNILNRAVAAAGINRDVKVHHLRHSYATHLLENGVSLAYIQAILGHKNIKTTQIYAKVRIEHLKNITLPTVTRQLHEPQLRKVS